MRDKFLNSQTFINLARSFAGESQAGLRYQILADKLKQEGYYFLTGTIKGIAKNEVSHAKAFYSMIIKYAEGPVENLEINAGYPFPEGNIENMLKLDVEIEREESDRIYTSFSKIAKDEGYEDVSELFKNISQVENCHSLLLEEMYEKFKSNKLFESPKKRKWKCDTCGYEAEGKEPWRICPICQNDRGYVQITFERGKTEEK